jgi:hypothetical protein
MQYIYNDGGRAAAGYSGKTGDCVCRAIAIITEIPYQTVYDTLNSKIKEAVVSTRIGTKRWRGLATSSSRTGVSKRAYHPYLLSLGYKWVSTMHIGSGCKVHLRKEELPSGRLIVRLSKHLTAVIDGVHYDIGDYSRNGTRCVYGYYRKD